MRFKFQVVLSLAAFAIADRARGGALDGRQSLHDHRDRYAHSQYDFKYVVNDPRTGDFKTRWETRDGDLVRGCYSLLEPDGTIRHVEYRADKRNGFISVVKKTEKQRIHFDSVLAPDLARGSALSRHNLINLLDDRSTSTCKPYFLKPVLPNPYNFY